MKCENIDFNDLEKVFSSERIGRYLEWASGDEKVAVNIYAKNIELSSSLYLPLHMIEVVLRNVVSEALKKEYGEKWIFDCDIFDSDWHKNQVYEKIERIKKNNNINLTYGKVVAEQSFAFWTSMFGRKYDFLWQKCLYQIVYKEKRSNVDRKTFSERLSKIRYLRNRIAHHEPIIHLNNIEYYNKIIYLLDLISCSAKSFCIFYETFTEAEKNKKETNWGSFLLTARE